CAERHRLGKPADRTGAASAVRAWLSSDDLAPVRGVQALAELPPDERRDWEALWVRGAALAARDPVEVVNRARTHVGRREWAKADACYAERFELDPPENSELWFEYAASQLLAGDRPGYRQGCATMLARCQPAGPMRPYLVGRACTLGPD